jgi:hypothetical protein
MPLIREGKPFFIYALVCPITLDVKYVGQTIDLEQRTRGRAHGSTRQNGPLYSWLKTLGYLKPYRVILERGINRRVELPPLVRRYARGRKSTSGATWLSSCLEAKWIKRFRHTVVNKNKAGMANANSLLVNPPLPWDNASDAPTEAVPTRSYKRKEK